MKRRPTEDGLPQLRLSSRALSSSCSLFASLLLMVGVPLVLPFVSLQAKPGPDLATFAKEIKPLFF